MKVGNLGQFKNLCDRSTAMSLEIFANKLFFISNVNFGERSVEIVMFHTGEAWVFDLIELEYYADIFCP
jgi:hypothetical protein|tara:strand:+ start:123 stop:329 length:207 start_codon:yes stop_codon:yes gene_type:complete